MCLLQENDSDNIIIDKLKKILHLSEDEYNKMITDSYNVSINNHTYSQGLVRFNKIMNYINTES